MKRVAARVECYRGVVAGNVDMQADVGVGHGDVGALAGLLAKLVNDGVLYLVGHEV